jgi:AAA domain (dynein-related subfamily)
MTNRYNQMKEYHDIVYANATKKVVDTAWFEKSFRAYAKILWVTSPDTRPVPLEYEKCVSFLKHFSENNQHKDFSAEKVLLAYFIDEIPTITTDTLKKYEWSMTKIVQWSTAKALDQALLDSDYETEAYLVKHITIAEKVAEKMLSKRYDPNERAVWQWEIHRLLNMYYANQDYLSLVSNDIWRNYEHIKIALKFMAKKLHHGEYVKLPSLKPARDLLETAYAKRVDKTGKSLASKMVTINGETWGGKTAMAIAFAKEKTWKDPIVIACNPSTGSADLVGTKELIVVYDEKGNPSPKTDLIAQWFQKAAIEWRMVVLDEYTHLNPETKAIVNKYLDLLEKKGQMTEKDWNGWGTYPISDKYFVIGTKNIGEQYHHMYEAEKSWQNRTEEIDLPVLSARDMHYFVLAKMSLWDSIVWPKNLSQTISGMISMKRTMEQQLLNNTHQTDPTIQKRVRDLSVFSNRVLRDIIDYAAHDTFVSLEQWIWKTTIDKWWALTPQHKIYLFALAKESGLFANISPADAILPATTNITTIINNPNTEASVLWTKITQAFYQVKPSSECIKHNKVLLLRNQYDELQDSIDNSWNTHIIPWNTTSHSEDIPTNPFIPHDPTNPQQSTDFTPLDNVNVLWDEDFLRHAPKAAKEYFETLDDDTKDSLKDIVEYTEDSINFTVEIDGKKMVIPFEKENITHADVTKNRSEKIKTETIILGGESIKETFFERDYLNQEYLEKWTSQSWYTTTSIGIIPQDSIYEAIMKSMPAKDYVQWSFGVSWKQAYWLLWWILSGYRSSGSSNDIGDFGYLRSASAHNANSARAVRSDSAEGILVYYTRINLFPLRGLRTPPYEA